MHRAVLLATTDEIGPEAIMTPDGQQTSLSGQTGTAATLSTEMANAGIASQDATAVALVGRTVAEVERDLIIDTLYHCLGNRTHAANILGISIRTLRNKLRQYTGDGIQVPMPGEAKSAAL